MTERDTKFQGFANLLWDDLLAELDQRLGMTLRLTPKEQKIVKDVFAQRAYDLVQVSCEFLDNWEMMQAYDHSYDWEALFEKIPDLTQWPKTAEP